MRLAVETLVNLSRWEKKHEFLLEGLELALKSNGALKEKSVDAIFKKGIIPSDHPKLAELAKLGGVDGSCFIDELSK